MSNENEETAGNGPMYRVIAVAGHPPASLADLIGATTVTVESNGHEHRLIGVGVEHGQSVVFQQKEAGSAVDTGPVWTMTDHGDGGLVAWPRVSD